MTKTARTPDPHLPANSRNRGAPAAVFLSLALLIAGCARRGDADRQSTDALGRRVALPQRIERIVSIAPNVTELLFAAGAGAKVIAVDSASDFPPSVDALPDVGGMQPNVEKIAAMRPDVVIASTEGNHPSLAPALLAAGVPLFVVKTDRIAEIAPALRTLGELTGVAGGEQAARRLEEQLRAERRVRPRAPRVLFVVWTDPLYVAGQQTFTNDLFELTGAVNSVTVNGWPQYSIERLVSSPPDLILYPRGAVTAEQLDALLARLPESRAQVVAVDEDIFQRPGPRVADAARALNAILDASLTR